MRAMLTRQEFGLLEGITQKTLRRQLEDGRLLEAKLPREPGEPKTYGIPIWCLSAQGLKRAIELDSRAEPFLAATVSNGQSAYQTARSNGHVTG